MWSNWKAKTGRDLDQLDRPLNVIVCLYTGKKLIHQVLTVSRESVLRFLANGLQRKKKLFGTGAILTMEFCW